MFLPIRVANHPEASFAPAWHTVALTGLICGVAAVGLMSHAPAAIGPSRIASIYAPTIAVDLALLLYVGRIGRRRWVLRELIGVGWDESGRAASDVALAATGLCIVRIGEILGSRFADPNAHRYTAFVLPTTPAERAAWIVLSLTVGLSEEVVYRGYLQRQWGAFLRHPAAGIAISAALFGIAHVNQGALASMRIGLYGLGFGVLAWWRRSLIPGILCHTAIDALSGLGPHG